ncbi:MAG: hypothetical protein WCD57_15465 [Acidobacteriaceae bacterium]
MFTVIGMRKLHSCHAFHHKGQIVSMCSILGHPAPDTDLNQFE